MEPPGYSRGSCRKARLPMSLLFLLTATFTPSHAQSLVDVSSEVSASIPTMSTRTLTSSSFPVSITTTFSASSTTSSSPNSTIPSVTSRVTRDIGPSLFPPAGPISEHTDPERLRNESVFNYYFLILAVFGVVVAFGLWWVRRQRKLQKERMRLSGQNALARDLDGWVNTRRWMHGTWRHNQTANIVRREEGLNERGEAPPPYRPNEATATQYPTRAAQDPASGLTIPLRALSREGAETVQPPEYQETDHRQGSTSTRPDTASSWATRPGTADVRPNGSTRDLLRTVSTQPNG